MSATIVNGEEPKLVAQHPRLLMPLLAPIVGTMTAVLQTPVSQPKLVELPIRTLPEQEDQKLHVWPLAQHCARGPLRERVAG
jgi:hypothetical protein